MVQYNTGRNLVKTHHCAKEGGPGHPNPKKPRKLGHAPRSLYETGAECRSQSPPVVIDSTECSDNPPTVQQGLQVVTRL